MDAYLTQTAAQITAAVSGSSITQIRGNSWNFNITSLTLDSNKIQLVIKRTVGNEDSESILFIDTTGLLVINGAVAPDATKASLTYTGTTLTVVAAASVTAQLPAGDWKYGIQSISALGVVSEIYNGTFTITADTAKATE